MPHSYNKFWTHAVWSTKDRQNLIQPTVEKKLYDFMYSQFVELGCPVRIINGMPDHIHCLFLLNPNKASADIIKQIKGSSSHFVNENKFIPEKFAWQTGYAAYVVSDVIMDRTFNYIKKQKAHHQKKTFQHEYDEIRKMIENLF
ncbi:IS200/IS605 family transposase [soil metagenome]